MRGEWRRRDRVALLVVTGGAALLCLIRFRHIFADPFANVTGPLGDSQQMVWHIGWVPYAISHHLNPFQTDFLNYPGGVNLAWNTDIPLAGLVMWPVTAVFGPTFSYNAFMAAGFVLSTLTAFLAIRRLVSSNLGSAVGAFLYGFSPYIVAQAGGHTNLEFVPLPPLILMLLHELVVGRRRPAVIGALLGLAIGAQFLISTEIAATTVLVGGAGMLVLAVSHPRAVRPRVSRTLRTAATAIPVAALLVTAPILEMVFGPQRPTEPAQPFDWFVSDLLSFIVPSEFQALHSAGTIDAYHHFTALGTEEGSYIGLPLLLIIAVVVVWRRSSPLVRFSAVMALVCAVLSMGPHLHIGGTVTAVPLPALLFERLPLLDNILPSRIALYMWLFIGILAATFVAECQQSAMRVRIAGAVLVGTAVVALFPILSERYSAAAVPSFFSQGTPGVTGVALVLPSQGEFTWQPMQWQAAADFSFRMPGGDITAHSVPTIIPTTTLLDSIAQGVPPPPLDSVVRHTVASQLEAWAVNSVVVGPMDHRDAVISFMTALLRRPPTLVGGVALWTGVDATQIGAGG